MENMFFCVSFHIKSPKGVHTFWFTDNDMAIQFSLSLQMNPKVIDCTIYEVEANVAAEYDRKVKDPQILVTDSWERGKRPNRQPSPQTDAMERTEQTEQNTSQQTVPTKLNEATEPTQEHNVPQSEDETTAANAAERTEETT